MKKSIVSWSVLALVVGASFAGCTLITEVDRSKIKDNAGGDSGEGGANTGGANTGGSSVGGEGGANTGGTPAGGAGGAGGEGGA